MQTVLFEDIEKEVSLIRWNFLKRANKHNFFINHIDRLKLYERIVFDLTHKDFEYFLCYLLKNQGYIDPHIADSKLDKLWIDVVASKDGVTHFFQCKQWSSRYIDIKRVGETYAKIYILRKQYPDAEFHFITTSYLYPESKDFLEYHWLKLWENHDVVYHAKCCNLQYETNWEKLIEFIQEQRLERLLSIYNQSRFNIWNEGNVKSILRQDRLNELAKHSLNFRKWEKVLVPTKQNIFFNHFFQYWDLA